MSGEYTDEYGFVPLQPRLRGALLSLCSQADNGLVLFRDRGEVPESLGELEAAGLANVTRYRSGGVLVALSSAALAYETDEAAYLERRRAWEADQGEELREEWLHEWRLTHVTGAYGVAGVAIGFLLGKFFG